MSFAIIISEKGGAERRELFDKNEVIVGRLQGNDLMLQKSNVSKRHARLLFNHGRFIVADLESTNGTYVNGRKIARATVVREGDKIYVGDFVLRFEAGPGAVLAPESSPSAPGPREATAAELGASSAPSAGPREGISHYPLENDPDEGGQSAKVSIPAAAPLPRGGTQALPTQSPPAAFSGPATDGGNAQIHALAHQVVAAAPNSPFRPSPLPSSPTSPQAPPGATSSHTLKPGPMAMPSGREASLGAAARLALATVIDAVAERVDVELLRPWPLEGAVVQRVEQALREVIPRLRQDGELPESVDLAALQRDAQRELLALGPLGALLDDDEVVALQIQRHDVVSVQRGAGAPSNEPGFSSDEALRRAIARLCTQTGQPLAAGETIVERRLAHGTLLAILSPSVSPSSTMSFRRRRRAEAPLEDPVRSGVVARVAWTFLLQCLSARLGVLVIAPANAGSLLGSMLGSLPVDERIGALLPPELSVTLPPQASSFSLEGGRAEALLRQAARLGFDRLVVGSLGEGVGAALLEAVATRPMSVVAVGHGASVRQALARIAAEVCATRHGVSPEVAREWLAATFDLVVEVVRARDGRLRVLRVAEVMGADASTVVTRDLFAVSPERSAHGDSSISSTGTQPRFLEDLRTRGFSVDPTIFERTSAR